MMFDKDVIKEMMFFFDKRIDDEGYVTDEHGARVLAMDGNEIKADDIGGIVSVGGEQKLVRISADWNPVN